MKEERQDYFDRRAMVLYKSKEYGFAQADLKQNGSERYLAPNDPSSWLCARLVNTARTRWPELPRAKAIRLCALTLSITTQRLEEILNWNARYLAWHDGATDEETHAYPKRRRRPK